MRKQRQKSRGAVAVEFAIVAPVLFMILFAALEIGFANMMYHSTEAAAYEGARVAIVPGATAAEATRAAQSVLRSAGISSATIQITPGDLSQDTDLVSVQISVNYRDNTTLPPFYITNQPFVKVCELNREKSN